MEIDDVKRRLDLENSLKGPFYICSKWWNTGGGTKPGRIDGSRKRHHVADAALL